MTFYKTPDQFSSGWPRSSKTRRVWEPATAKRSLKRHEEWMECDILDGILAQKQKERLKTKEILPASWCCIDATDPSYGATVQHDYFKYLKRGGLYCITNSLTCPFCGCLFHGPRWACFDFEATAEEMPSRKKGPRPYACPAQGIHLATQPCGCVPPAHEVAVCPPIHFFLLRNCQSPIAETKHWSQSRNWTL